MRARHRICGAGYLAGAEPIEARSGSPLDYAHYRDRQLEPIAQSIANAVGMSADGWLGEEGQLDLFALAGWS